MGQFPGSAPQKKAAAYQVAHELRGAALNCVMAVPEEHYPLTWKCIWDTLFGLLRGLAVETVTVRDHLAASDVMNSLKK